MSQQMTSDTSVARPTANTVIESIGVYLPPNEVSTSDIISGVKYSLRYPLERLTGIKSRRMAGDTEFAIDLAVHAIENCLATSRYEAPDIDLIVCCNISRYDGPNFHFSFEPGTAIRLKKHFNMDSALAFDISNACAGMFTGVFIVNAFIKAGLIRRGLVVSGEYITHLTKTAQKEISEHVDSRVACLTLGDSGAAMILERAPSNDVGFHSIDMMTLGKYSDLCIARPTFEKHGGAIMLTESVKLHAVAIKQSVEHAIHHVLKLRKPPNKAMQYVIMHQTARTAIADTAKRINNSLKQDILHRDNMINNLADRGNTSTTTHFVALWDNILNDKIQSFDNMVFVVQASGITIGTAAYTFDDLPERVRGAQKGAVEKVAVTREPADAWQQTQLPRVRIESVGVVGDHRAVSRDAIELASIAGEAALDDSQYSAGDIDLLIHAGVHRNDFICEPALAAIIAGRMKLNDDIASPEEPTTFAFDIINGAIGFLDSCRTAVAFVKSRQQATAMVVASEIENNADVFPDQLVGLKETGSAIVLDEAPEGADEGFGAFVFQDFTEHIDDFQSYIGQEGGKSYLSFVRHPETNDHVLDCIPKVVDRLLKRERIDRSRITAVFPPQISPDFVGALADRLNMDRDRFVDIAESGKDYYTSSIPCAMHAARKSGCVKSGDVGLLIAAGTGVQVGCAIYYF
jgi:3-oxoacyl-[acyl-carrier-protein] synthase III